MQVLDANLRRLWPSFIVQELKDGLEILQRVVEGIEKVHYSCFSYHCGEHARRRNIEHVVELPFCCV